MENDNNKTPLKLRYLHNGKEEDLNIHLDVNGSPVFLDNEGNLIEIQIMDGQHRIQVAVEQLQRERTLSSMHQFLESQKTGRILRPPVVGKAITYLPQILTAEDQDETK